jgi:hypothetical protein
MIRTTFFIGLSYVQSDQGPLILEVIVFHFKKNESYEAFVASIEASIRASKIGANLICNAKLPTRGKHICTLH